MSEESRSRSDEFYSRQFMPVATADAAVRQAVALEYIAAQLGQMNRAYAQWLKTQSKTEVI
jgi:hypothetical protein